MKESGKIIDRYKSEGLKSIVERLEMGRYEDPVGHPLENNIAFIALKELANEK